MKLIERISLALLIPSLILAIFLAVNGVHQVNLSNEFYSFMKSVAEKSYDFNWEIPMIPTDFDVSQLPQQAGLFEFLSFLGNVGVFFIKVVNALSTIINTLIKIVEFFVIIFQDWDTFEQAILSGVS